MAHAIKIEAFLAQSRSLHIAQPVEYKEQPAIFEDASAIVGSRCGGRYVVLGVCDSTSIQFKTPSPTEIEAEVG